MRDAQAGAPGELEVLIDVALRIDDGGDAALLVADEIRRVGEAIEIKLMQDHGIESAHVCARRVRSIRAQR